MITQGKPQGCEKRGLRPVCRICALYFVGRIKSHKCEVVTPSAIDMDVGTSTSFESKPGFNGNSLRCKVLGAHIDFKPMQLQD
jgi:hypothetical protein